VFRFREELFVLHEGSVRSCPNDRAAVLLHAARQPQGTKRLHYQRDPAEGRQGLFEWLGIYFEQ